MKGLKNINEPYSVTEKEKVTNQVRYIGKYISL